MSAPHESKPDDHRLEQYLLGLLPDEDAERLDEMSIADEDVATRLAVVEDELVDAYVRRTMPEATRDRFEAVYLSSPRRREKVRFAEGFLRVADSAAPRVSPPRWGRPRGPLMWSLAIAAALVLLAGTALLVNQLRLRTELREAQVQSAALDQRARELERQLKDQEGASAQTVKELERVRAMLAELSSRQASGPPAGPAAPAPMMVALILPPPTRGSGPVTTLAVAAAASGVAFDLQLDASDFSRYDVVLKDPTTGRVVWRSGRSAARPLNGLPAVSVIVPAGMLASQHYALELSGHGADGRAQVVGSYAIRIVRR